MTKLITIVVPMFNEENSIEQCLKSLISQSNQNFNVIFIDDGSTDSTLKNLKKLLKSKRSQYSFSYEIISQKNAGAAMAREIGVRNTETEYIMFLDCDDVISDNMIQSAIKIILSDKPDILLSQLKTENSNGTFTDFKFYDERKTYSGDEALKYSLVNWEIHGSICVKKEVCLFSYEEYSRYNPQNIDYLNNDEVITRLNFKNSKKIIKHEGIYYYKNNTHSITKKINPKRIYICKNAIIIYQLFKDGYGKEISLKSEQELINTFWGTFRYYRKNKRHLSNKELWSTELKNTYLYIINHSKNMNINLKSKIRLLRAKLLLLLL